MKRTIRFVLLVTLLLMTVVPVKAQYSMTNTAFQAGETLTYNLYFNWKFVWVNCGTASMSIQRSSFSGQPALKASLITHTSSKVDNFFVMRDTLMSYCTQDLKPLYFRKGAREGKRYTVDQVWYSYSGSGCQLKQSRYKQGDGTKTMTKNRTDVVLDMMNMFLRARNFNPSGWKAGHVVKMNTADGNSIDACQLRYVGKKTIKGDDKRKYRCLELAFSAIDDGKMREIVRFFVTDDANHIPVRLDLSLKFGSAKAYIKTIKGNRSAITSIEK